MKPWLRHHRYALRVALLRLARQPMSSLANIVVIALMLCVPLVGAALLQASQPLVRDLSTVPELTLFLQQDLPAARRTELLQRLREHAGQRIEGARLLEREQALEQLRADPTWAQALDALPENPLPDTIIVSLQESEAPAQLAAQLAQAWEQWPEIDHVQLDSEWVQRLESLLGFVRVALALLSGAVVLVVMATVFNIVRLQALTQRDEIAVARLVGATESFVRRPFLYLGALTGAGASLLALLLADLALLPLNSWLGELAASYGVELALRLPAKLDLLLALLMVVVLGALAARFSVTRHTRF